MIGMSRHTGRAIDDEAEHIRQAIGDILTTPVGSRVENRTYGSLLPDLVDHPGNAANHLRLAAASIMAIIRWEPRVSVQSASIAIDAAGRVAVDFVGARRGGPRSVATINVSVPLQ